MSTLLNAFQSINASPINEPNLGHYYLTTPAIELARVSDNLSCILSGLKGTGKTAAYRGLKEFGTLPNIVQSISPEEYALNLPNTTLRASACSQEFEYEIAIQLLNQVIVQRKELNGELSSSLYKSAKSHITDFKKKLKNIGKKITGLNVLGCGFNLADPQRPVLSGLEGRQDELRAINTLIAICETGISMRLVIDDPENVFTASSELDKALLGGLWLAAARITRRSANLKVIVLMKTHVWDFVRTNTPDLDQYPDSDCRLSWSSELLKGLISKRLEHFFDIPLDKWEETLFGGTSNSNLVNQFFNILFQNIRNGPREMYRWLYLAAKRAENEGRKNITQSDLKSELRTLSYWAFNTFNTTHSEEFMDVGAVVRAIFKDDPDRERTPKALEEHIRQLILKDPEFQSLNNLKWMQSLTSDTIPHVLFRSGVVALRVEDSMILPYMEDYTEDSWRDADTVSLVPLFRIAVSKT